MSLCGRGKAGNQSFLLPTPRHFPEQRKRKLASYTRTLLCSSNPSCMYARRRRSSFISRLLLQRPLTKMTRTPKTQPFWAILVLCCWALLFIFWKTQNENSEEEEEKWTLWLHLEVRTRTSTYTCQSGRVCLEFTAPGVCFNSNVGKHWRYLREEEKLEVGWLASWLQYVGIGTSQTDREHGCWQIRRVRRARDSSCLSYTIWLLARPVPNVHIVRTFWLP